MTTPNPTPALPARPVFKVTRRGTGEVIAPGTVITDRSGEAHTFRYATRPTTAGTSGKVVVDSSDWPDRELYASVFGLIVTRVVPAHRDIFERGCRFSGTASDTGECPVCPPGQVAGGADHA